MSNARLGKEGSEMSGSPGSLIDGSGKSKSGRGIDMSKAKLGSEGREMSGSPGSFRDGRLQDTYAVAISTFVDATPTRPVTPVNALFTPGTAVLPRQIPEPSI